MTDHLEFLNDPESRAYMMHAAAVHYKSPDLVALLHEMGISLDTVEWYNPSSRPINCAAAVDRWDTVRWLVEHGAELNYETGDRVPDCYTLHIAIGAGRLDIVKLLVEHDAVLDVCDRRDLTPLAWAVNCGRKEIADYLRGQGAIMPEQARNFNQRSPIQKYINRTLIASKLLDWEPPPRDPPIVIHCIVNVGYLAAITEGMSAQAMNVPAGFERYRFAELALRLSEEYWPSRPPDAVRKAWLQEQYVWAIEWLHRLTRYPFEKGTWLGEPTLSDPSPMIANGEPPQPLSPYTKMTCWLLLVDKDELTGFTRPDGAEVVFYTLIAIHTAERDFVRKHGLKALLEKFAEADVPSYLDPNRESVV